MATPLDVTIVSLGEADRSSLRALMSEQRDEWLEALDWDLAEINAALVEALRNGSISGSAALAGDRVVAFGFYTVESDRCLLGDAFVTVEYRHRGVYELLVDDLIRRASEVAPLRRIENHTITLDADVSDSVLKARGFEAHERDYLVRAVEVDGEVPAGHSRARMRAWDDADFARVSELIYQSYRGTVDAKLNCQYRSRDGCSDLLDALTNTVWCGRFDPETTRVALDGETNRLCGVAIATRISTGTAHLGQVSVHPVYQGQGIGRALVRSTIDAAARRGLSSCSLAVTRENRVAGGLYRSLGFEPRREFRVYTRDRNQRAGT